MPSAPPAGAEAGWAPVPPGPPTVTWPGAPASAGPPPASRSTGRTVAIAVGVTVPILVIALAVAAYLVLPKVLTANSTTDPTATPTPSGPDFAVPAIGTCFRAPARYDPLEEVRSGAEEDEAVPCDQRHRLETISVGTLEGPRPFVPSNESRDLYDECSAAAEEFLGAPWRTMRTWLVVSLPSSRAWRAGAQWYRCDLATTDSYGGRDHVDTTGNLADTATPLGCMTWTVMDGSLSGIEVSDCDVPHQGEIAGGLWARDVDRSDEDAFLRALDDGCEPIVLEFLDRPDLHPELTYWYIYPSDPSAYDQSVLCVVAATEDGRSFTSSVQGVGSGPIPFA